MSLESLVILRTRLAHVDVCESAQREALAHFRSMQEAIGQSDGAEPLQLAYIDLVALAHLYREAVRELTEAVREHLNAERRP